MKLARLMMLGMLAANLLGACVSPSPQPLVLLQRPQRPILSTTQEIQAALKAQDITQLNRLYARDIAELQGYARQLEAQLNSVERQLERRYGN